MQERASAVRGVEVKDDTIPGGGRATVGVACATGLPDAGTDAAARSGIPFQSGSTAASPGGRTTRHVASSPGPNVDRGIAT